MRTLQTELRREALHLAEEFRERNRTALLNLLSDSTIGRVFSGFSDTATAFLIIACEHTSFHTDTPPHSDSVFCVSDRLDHSRGDIVHTH